MTTSDPENYFNLSKPFENKDLCNEALKSFYDDIEASRKKHSIRDVVIITSGAVKYGEKTSEFLQHSAFGNSLNHCAMAAYAYGQLKAEDIERLNDLLSGNVRK